MDSRLTVEPSNRAASVRSQNETTPPQKKFIEPSSSYPQSADFSGLSGGPALSHFPHPESGATLDGLSPAIGDSWVSMVNLPLLPMFQKSSMANNNVAAHSQTVDLAAAKLKDFYGSGSNVARLDGPKKFRRSSKGHMDDGSSSTSAANNGVTNNRIYSNDGDLISGQHAPGGGCVPNASSRSSGGLGMVVIGPAHNTPCSLTIQALHRSDDGGNVIAAAHRQATLANPRMGGFNIGVASPRLGKRNSLNMAQLAQSNGMSMTPFGANVNMFGMANLSAMGISSEAQLPAAQITSAGGKFGEPGLGLDAGLGGLPSQHVRRHESAWRLLAQSQQCERYGWRRHSGGSGKKTDEEDFDPPVLNDVAGRIFSFFPYLTDRAV
ncbi:hypothetical protein EI94DRAFT_1892650 [Lactarius quietus]|nr:hypothetical protein EI94DRAFT_1892650 [Lactarius quietus]